MEKNARNRWIQAGYKLFAVEGADGIKVERLARILKLNKSGFYHYFSSQDNFFNELFLHHQSAICRMALETQHCKSLDPDYFKLVLKYKLSALVQGQLAKHTKNPSYGSVLKETSRIAEHALLPLWRKAFNLPDDPELVRNHFALFRNAFHARAQFEKLTYQLLHEVMAETNHMMLKIFRHGRWNNGIAIKGLSANAKMI